jgi:hypothetical protein
VVLVIFGLMMLFVLALVVLLIAVLAGGAGDWSL